MGLYNAHIKIDQVGIVGVVSLSMAYSMWIMAGTTRRLQITDVLIMIIKRFIIQDTGPAMTAVA